MLNKGKNLITILFVVFNSLVVFGCKTNKGLKLNDEKYINYFGRVLVSDNYVDFYNTCSGFELNFSGREVKATFTDGYGQYLRVFVDDIDNGLVEIKEQTVLYISNNESFHKLKAIRANSESKGIVRLTSINGYQKISKAPTRSNLKFEFYGDSITAGYEINNNGTGDSVTNEDGTKTYAKLATDYFNAEASILCYSGISVSIHKWITDWLLPERYDQYSLTTNSEKWDFNKYQADYVIINLGTNDAAAITETNKEQFYYGYLNFLQKIRNYNSTASIVCCYGMMGSNAFIVDGITNAIDYINDSKISFLNMTSVECALETGHPTRSGQIDGANQLKAHLLNLMESN